MKHINDLQSITLLCAVFYAFSGSSSDRFTTLVQCISKDTGFTSQCGELWAHYSATNAALCASDCMAGASGNVTLNGAAPECALSSCLQCSADKFQDTFNALSGRTLAKSGITEAIARPCSSFFPVDHDPCPMTGTGVPLAPSMVTVSTNSPAKAPSTSSTAKELTPYTLVLDLALVTFLLSLP